MSSLSLAFTLAAAAEAGAVGGLPPIVFGITAFAVFMLLLLLAWLFRHSAQTMIEGHHVGEDYARTHGGATGGAPGSGH
ncbi:hypothetical protein [Gephyromycinifex aptenodytis]|uniref:hypothetical protein n=1 Tax=Gephyromycinifex aptenodytis TaxID=2716227 RepID=UPI001447E9D7|nr:hypothetical protein [Gephyromycinifex aptenodytis]